MIREQPLGVLHSLSSRGLHENVIRSWGGMEDAHLKIPKQAFLARWMYAGKLPDSKIGFLYCGYLHLYLHIHYVNIYIYVYIYIYILHICIDVYRYLHIYSYTCRL